MDILNSYNDTVTNKTNKIITEEKDNIDKAAGIMAEAVKTDKNVYFFGSGHSYIIGWEVFARAGGYSGFVPILENELGMNHAYKSTLIERTAAYAGVIEGLYDFRAGEVIVFTSNSGRNALIIELAMRLREKGLKIIVMTALEQSKNSCSRHESGKLLYEFADVILDNKSEKGDAAINHSNNTSTGPTSTVIGCFIINLLVSSMVEKLIQDGYNPGVFTSSNVDEGDERNEGLFDKYQ